MGRHKWFVLVLAALLLVALVLALFVLRKAFREQLIACTNYDSRVWAQTVYDTNPSLACKELLHAVAPALWMNEELQGR